MTDRVSDADFSESPTARLYRVQDDDDLRAIAGRLYGHPDFWVFIYGANAKSIVENGGIRPGQILYIPDP